MIDYVKLNTIAKEKSFTNAAKVLNMTQPALSQSIKKIEMQLGFAIFLRSKNGVSLTKKGIEILKLSNSYMFLDKYYKSITNQKDMVLSVGMVDSVGIVYAERLKNQVDKMYPNTVLQVVVDNSKNLTRELSLGNIDFAIITNNIESSPTSKIHFEYFSQEKLYCFAHKNYFARLEKLSDLPNASQLISYNKNSNTYKIVQSLLAKNKLNIEHTFYSTSPELILKMIEAKQGIGFLPEYYQYKSSNLVQIFPDILNIQREFIICCDSILYKTTQGKNILKLLKSISE